MFEYNKQMISGFLAKQMISITLDHMSLSTNYSKAVCKDVEKFNVQSTTTPNTVTVVITCRDQMCHPQFP